MTFSQTWWICTFLSFVLHAGCSLHEAQYIGGHNVRLQNCSQSFRAVSLQCVRLCFVRRDAGPGKCLATNYNSIASECELCSSLDGLVEEQGWQTWRRVTSFRDCSGWYTFGMRTNGVYSIYPGDENTEVKVYCDMESDGGGWTVILRRLDGSVTFDELPWVDYKRLIGSSDGEYYLGNDITHALTGGEANSELRVDLEDFENVTKLALYSTFSVADESDLYRLTVTGYDATSTAGDSLTRHDGQQFSAIDADNDGSSSLNCADKYRTGWWYVDCHSVLLTGAYLGGTTSVYAQGVTWKDFKGYYYSLKRAEMKIRPRGFGN